MPTSEDTQQNRSLSRIAVAAGALAALLLTLTACSASRDKPIKGSGVETSSQRRLSSFQRVELRGAADVSVSAGKSYSVVVSGDRNLLADITTRVEGGTLVIDQRHDYTSKIGIKLEVAVPRLVAVVLSGSGTVTAGGISGPSFDGTLSGSGKLSVSASVPTIELLLPGSGQITVDDSDAIATHVVIAGSGEVEASGKSTLLWVSIPGSGSVRLDQLPAQKASVSISGSGEAAVSVSDRLEVDISGSGSVSYGGNPRHVIKKISGSGSVEAG